MDGLLVKRVENNNGKILTQTRQAFLQQHHMRFSVAGAGQIGIQERIETE